MKIVLFGAPGSGKGTQAQDLSRHYSAVKISLGDILRQEVKKGSLLGNEVKGYMEAGVLVPDNIVTKVIEENINHNDFILDGYPRNISQAEHLDKILAKLGKDFDAAVYLDIDEPTVVNRLELRRVCRQCGKNYHLVNLPSEKEGICDSCGGNLYQRDDDKPEVIKERLSVFLKESQPLLDFYKSKGRLIKVNAGGDKDEVFNTLKELINHGKFIKS